MKFNKIFAFALAALAFTACKDDDDFNTAGDVNVQMQEAQMSVSEDFNGTYYNIPVIVTGDANGPIKVTVEVTADPANAANEDEHYVITEKTINIPADKKVGNIQFYPTGDDQENQDRKFIATITSAEGAKIGTQSSTVVTLLDNERLLPEAYAKVVGTWAVSCDAGTYPIEIVGYDKDEEGYLKEVEIVGFHGDPDLIGHAGFSLDAITGRVLLSFEYGQSLGRFNFTNFGVQDVLLIGFDGTYIYPTGSQAVESNDEVNQFVFAEGLAGAFNSGGWRAYFMELDIVWKKIAE